MLSMRFILRSIITAFAVWVTTLLPLEVVVDGGDGQWWARLGVFLLIGILITLMNAIIKPIVNMLALPLMILTRGLFALVVGWFMLWLTAWLSEFVPWATLEVGGFWNTLWAALVIAITTAILALIIPGARKD